MTAIWKFTLEPGHTSVEMPVGARVLDAQPQGDVLQLWALVDPEAPRTWRDFYVVGTGHELPETAVEWKHISTVQFKGGRLIVHVFEKGAPSA
jgi:hypothetical protein